MRRRAGEREKQLAKLHFAMEVGLFVASVGLVLAFVILWVIEDANGKHLSHIGENAEKEESAQHAYIVEHVAYIVFLLFYAAFFAFHTPDPLEGPGLYQVYVEEHATDPEGVCMKPLIRQPQTGSGYQAKTQGTAG